MLWELGCPGPIQATSNWYSGRLWNASNYSTIQLHSRIQKLETLKHLFATQKSCEEMNAKSQKSNLRMDPSLAASDNCICSEVTYFSYLQLRLFSAVEWFISDRF